MNRKLLWILNLALAAGVVYAGIQFRDQRRAARARDAAMLHKSVNPVPPPPYSPLPAEPAVLPSGYINIAQKMLFDRSRDPNVPIEVPAPPPVKPVPPLPVYHGMMSIGGKPTAFLSLAGSPVHQAVRPGDIFGPFKLLSVDGVDMALEWEGQVIHKNVDELIDRSGNVASAPVQDSRTEVPAPAAVAAAPPAPVKSGPGESTAFGFKTCDMKDGQAEGAVMEGYRKVVHSTPFGQSCTWEPVGK